MNLGGFFGAKLNLLQLGFLVSHMLARLGIKFHDGNLLRRGLLVFACGVEMAGSCSRFQLDFFASAFACHEGAPVRGLTLKGIQA
jgi:hypothetical protein